jgi:CRP/FNR family transcriptional regulator, anaerobic regulatory protein
MEELFKLFDAIEKLEPDLRVAIEEILVKKTYRKNVRILKEGDTSKFIYYVEKGLVRAYRPSGDNEMTTWFMKEGDIFVSVGSFFHQKKATENIVTVEPCTFHCISFEQLQALYAKFPRFNFHRATLLEHYYALSDSREHMRMQCAADRYRYLMEHQPELVERVQDKFLASYLGIGGSTFRKEKMAYPKYLKTAKNSGF